MTATPKRRWLQFSLRTLLVMMTMACVGLAWLAYQRNEVRKREAAIAAIEEMGGEIHFDEMQPFRPVWLHMLFSSRSPAEVVGVNLDGTNASDDDLSLVAGLTKLEWLILFNTPVTDAGLVQLADLTNLEELTLNYTQVTDAGLVHLSGLTKLNRLYLHGSRVTDQGVAALKQKLPNLQITQ